MRLISFFALGGLVACSTGFDLSAEDELTLASISGEEEDLARGLTEPDNAWLPLFRVCDAGGAYAGMFSDYDADQDGALRGPEEREVATAFSDPMMARARAHRMEMLTLIYDSDDSGVLGSDERTQLLGDFTARCEIVHAGLLADYDVDDNGVLEGSELESLRADHASKHQEHMAEMHELHADRSHGRPTLPPSAVEFDTDHDDALSADELVVLRAVMIERIRTGEPLFAFGSGGM